MLKKQRREILEDILTRLENNSPITDTDPGSIARTFAEILTEQFHQFYTELEMNSVMSFVSTATGRHLDMIGRLLDCERLTNEGDENYRTRITNQVYVVAGGNLTSIRLKALAISGVSDIIFREFTHGAGSFTAYVIADEPTTSRRLLNEVEAVINDTKSFGVYADVRTPVLIPLNLMVRILFKDSATSNERSIIRQTVANNIKRYVDNVSLGETVVMNEIITQAMSASDKIHDADIYAMRVDGVNRFVSNISSNWDERVVLESIDIG